jgi:hypothetical protein
MPESSTNYTLQLLLQAQHPESRRKPGHHLLSYQWSNDSDGDSYWGPLPIPLDQTSFKFTIVDYTKSLESPTVKIDFVKVQGSEHSPFSEADTKSLQDGVASTRSVDGEEFNVWVFNDVPFAGAGNGFSFSVDIDDRSNPQDKWFVDPQMIVEEG